MFESFRKGGDATDSPDGGAGASPVDLTSIKSEARANTRAKSKLARDAATLSAQAEIDKLFEEENWRVIAALPFKARFAVTGWEGFNLTETENRVLGSTMATAMRVLLQIDPRYIAVIVFTVNFAGIYVSKELAYKEYLKVMEARKSA